MRIVIYLGVLLVLLGFGSLGGGLIGLPISFLLKNKLHLEAREMAIFALIAGAPSHVSFLFGFVRDIWNPTGHAGPRLHGAVRGPVRGRIRRCSPSRR